MRFIYLLCALFLCNNCSGQNIIANSDFAEFANCPSSYSQTNYCKGWYQPTDGTSDYFHSCAAGSDVWVPTNFAGHKTSPSNAYLGFILYDGPNYEYREYIGTSFEPLKIGENYKVSITIALASKCVTACNGIGALFTTHPFYQKTRESIKQKNQVSFGNNDIVRDTNWVTFTNDFKADSAYTNIIIGCFENNNDLKLLSTNGSTRFGRVYYYVCSVSVEGPPPPPVDTTKHVFPTAFSPNGDGSNDQFRVISNVIEQYTDYSLSVFNRWGELVYTTDEVKSGWNGIYNGLPASIGTYFYLAEFKIKGVRKLLKGDVTLIR